MLKHFSVLGVHRNWFAFGVHSKWNGFLLQCKAPASIYFSNATTEATFAASPLTGEIFTLAIVWAQRTCRTSSGFCSAKLRGRM